MSKAITLPVNILVIVAIAVIVLLGLVALYFVGFNPFSSAIGLEGVKNAACRQLVFGGCKKNTTDITVAYDANKNGVNDSGTNFNWATGTGDDNLAALCYNFFGRKDEKSCKQLCGCVGGTVSGGGGGPCTPTTCAALGKDCGNWPDGCGGTLNCGTCNIGFNCINGVCTPAGCVCSWNNNFACGVSPTTGASCKVFVFFNAWWKKCDCTIPNCGLCMPEGAPDDVEICTGIMC
jgi:hypothetical protein